MEPRQIWQIMFFVYMGVMILVGVLLRKRVTTLDVYVIAGKRVSGFLVAMVLLATMIGPSALIGYAQTSYQIGVSAAWIPWAKRWSDVLKRN